MKKNKVLYGVAAVALVTLVAGGIFFVKGRKSADTSKTEKPKVYDGLDVTDKTIEEAESKLQEDAVTTALKSSEYINSRYKLEQTVQQEVIQQENGSYLLNETIIYYGFTPSKLEGLDTKGEFKLKLQLENTVPYGVEFDIIDVEGEKAKLNTEIRNILTSVVGESIAEEVFTQENGVMIENNSPSEQGKIETLRNVQETNGLMTMNYYAGVIGKERPNIQLADFTPRDEKASIADKSKLLLAYKEEDNFLKEIKKYYSAQDNTVNVLNVLYDTTINDMSVVIDAEIQSGGKSYPVSVEITKTKPLEISAEEMGGGFEAVTIESELLEKYTVDLPEQDTEQKAVENALAFVREVYKAEVQLEDGVDVKTASSVNYYGIAGEQYIAGVLQKTIEANGKCRVTVTTYITDAKESNEGYLNFLFAEELGETNTTEEKEEKKN